jgi:hypothetical protein
LCIALDSYFAYVTDNTKDEVVRLAKDGTSFLVVAKASPTPWGIAVDDARVYWPNACGPDCGYVSAVGKDGSNPVTLASKLNSPMGIAVDSSSVYWIEYYEANAKLRKIAKGGGAVTTLASDLGQTSYTPVVDDSCAYWASTLGGVMRTAK